MVDATSIHVHLNIRWLHRCLVYPHQRVKQAEIDASSFRFIPHSSPPPPPSSLQFLYSRLYVAMHFGADWLWIW